MTDAPNALSGDEVASTRLFLRLGWIVAAAAIVGVLALPGDRRIAHVLLAAIGATTAWSIACYRTLDRPSRATRVTMLAFACVACGTLANVYAGYMSAAPLVIALGLYFFCRIAERGPAIAVYACTAISHIVAALLVETGAIRDPAFAPAPPHLSIEATLVAIAGIQLAYATAFWLARSTRAASLHAIEQLQRATRTAALRLVQVHELRGDLDRALGIGVPGRFTNAVVGDWELGVVLGRGGVGEVYQAKHVDRGGEAAVKLLRRELMIDRNHVERFLREVRAASALESPHVVRVLDASKPDELVPFFAMERLHGATLGAMVRGAIALPRTTVIEAVAQLAGALDLARVAGVVHRDLKPSNLFRTDDGTWKLLDFGAAALGGGTGTLTEGFVIGTPGYMAPEQAKGDPVDHRADLYALAAVVYRCATDRVPFAGDQIAALLYAMVEAMPVRPSALAPLPRDLDRFLAIGLAKQPADRFQTAGELADALAAAYDDRLPARTREHADALMRRSPWRELDD